MKNITEYITEAGKFDYWEDAIEFPGYEFKVPKKYIKKIDFTPKNYKEDFLTNYFGWINQWIDKNVKKIAKEVAKDDNKNFPKEIWIKLPGELGGKLYLEWDTYWSDGIPSGKLKYVQLKVNNVSPSSMSTSRFYSAQEDLERFKMINEIKF